jgi:hypothetical protein
LYSGLGLETILAVDHVGASHESQLLVTGSIAVIIVFEAAAPLIGKSGQSPHRIIGSKIHQNQALRMTHLLRRSYRPNLTAASYTFGSRLFSILSTFVGITAGSQSHGTGAPARNV